MNLTLDDERTVTVHDPLEALQLLRGELESHAATAPILVSIDGVWDLHIDAGLAAGRGVIHTYAASAQPPYWVTFDPSPASLGDSPTVVFMLHGRHHTELPAQYLISDSQLWPALQSLLVDGVRSSAVEWREV